jgi:SAM-dependent methyltransferase
VVQEPSRTRSPRSSARWSGIDASEDLVDVAREHAPPGCTFVVGDAEALPFPYGDFDLVGCLRVLHHVRRPELVVAEIARVTRPGGTILLADQLGDIDPMRSLELDRFERARDPSHTRLLPDADIRGYLDANDLVVVANEIVNERRDMERYLDVAGLEGEARERVARMAPAVYEVEVGWYVARKV